jgi:hypothetical protein
MDLFKAFPSLRNYHHHTLDKKSLRLISLSGLVYDDEALYFEFSPEKFWGRLPEGKSAIGIGLPKVKPDGILPPQKKLMQYLYRNWRCETNLYPPGYAFIMDQDKNVSIISGMDIPFIMQMTPPKLGGVNIPDALVQVVYLLPIQQFIWHTPLKQVDLLRISRSGFDEFLASEIWLLSDIVSESWSELRVKKPLPQDAVIRMILTLRSLRELLKNDTINLDLLSGMKPS